MSSIYHSVILNAMRNKNAKTARPGEATRFESEKIMVARMGKSLVATYDQGGLYVKDAMLLLPLDQRYNMKYLLGLINSHLLNYFYGEFFVTIDVLKNAILSLPIRAIDFHNFADSDRYNKIVRLVETMLDAKQRLAAAKTDKDKIYYENKCTFLDRHIDMIVYDLYGLTEEETNLVKADNNGNSRVPSSRQLTPNVLPLDP